MKAPDKKAQLPQTISNPGKSLSKVARRAVLSTAEYLESRTLLSATLTVANLDILPGPERMVFNRIQRQPPHTETAPDGTVTQPPNNVVHDKATLQLGNSGDAPLVISSLKINGPWQIINSPALTIAPGGVSDITLQFVATSEPAHSYNETNANFNPNYGGMYSGTLTVATNDPNNASYVEQLAGWWQYQSEASVEPSLQTLVNQLFNYKTVISPTATPNLPEPNNQKVVYGEEVLSSYWKAANASQPVYARAIGSWHIQGNPSSLYWYPQNGRRGPAVVTIPGVQGQSLLPTDASGAPAAGSFSPGSSPFVFQIDYERSIDSANPTGGGGHHIRFYPVRDHTGAIIPNTYLMALDYSAGAGAVDENFDFQDVVYVVTNLAPANGAARAHADPNPTPHSNPRRPDPNPNSNSHANTNAHSHRRSDLVPDQFRRCCAIHRSQRAHLVGR